MAGRVRGPPKTGISSPARLWFLHTLAHAPVPGPRYIHRIQRLAQDGNDCCLRKVPEVKEFVPLILGNPVPFDKGEGRDAVDGGRPDLRLSGGPLAVQSGGLSPGSEIIGILRFPGFYDSVPARPGTATTGRVPLP